MRHCALLLMGFLAAAQSARAETCVPTGPDLAAAGWQELRFDDKTPNRYTGDADGTITVEGTGTVSILYRTLSVDLVKTPVLRWQWRTNGAVPATDLAQKGGDDRAVGVYVSFPYDSGSASLKERMARTIVEMREGPDAPGRFLAYTWGGAVAPGTVLDNPYAGPAGPIIVLRPAGGRTDWIPESVDVAADYRRIFSAEATRATQVAIVADSDDTGVSAAAAVRGLCFSAR